MARKRKKKLKIVKYLFFIALVVVIILFYKSISKQNVDTDKDVNKTNDKTEIKKPIEKKTRFMEISNIKESDTDIIKNTFAEGMSEKDFKNILLKEDNYIKSNQDYEKLNYNFEEKLHYSVIEDYLKKLNNSSIVKLELIGSSVDNRNIYSIEIGKGNKTVLIDANIHAAEIANTTILLKYMITLVNEYESGNTEIINMLNNVKLVVLPCINPDGYEVYNFGVDVLNNKELWIYQNRSKIDFENLKSNANGVDINRNMPTQNAGLYYKKYNLISSVALEKTTSNSKYFGGTALGSEPETKALMYFMLKHYKNTTAYINMHSQGRVIYQGKPNLSNDFNNLCKNFANFVSSYNDYRVYGLSAEEVGEGNDGSATDFMAELANNLVYSSKTGRLASISYENNNYNLVYKYPVITLETIDRYTRNPKYFSDEYIYRNYYKMFNNLLKEYSK